MNLSALTIQQLRYVVAVDRHAQAEPEPGQPTRELAGNVRDYATMAGISARIRDEFGHLDFVVCNAAITDWGLMSNPMIVRPGSRRASPIDPPINPSPAIPTVMPTIMA